MTDQRAARRELRNAESNVAARHEKLLQFKDALRLVPFIEKSEEATSDVVAPTDEQQPAANANATPPVENSAPDSLSDD